MKYHAFIKSDVEKILAEANFTADQNDVFRELINPHYRTRYTDVYVCQKLHISRAKFYKIKKEIDIKVERILN